MADSVLTSLCSICHISTPKYKCPRCTIRTCSLACIKKHKAWSECTGERDATAYVVPSKLRTPAGIDHDYNFLHGIELSVERAEKLLVEERAVVQEEELRPQTIQEIKWKPGRDGRKRKVLVTRTLREAKGRTFERFLAQRLRKLNIEIMCAPMGMSRQKENHTTLNRRTGRINWQVEWLALEDTGDADDRQPRKKRGLSKVMDDVPLWQAYHTFLEEQKRVGGQQTRRTMRPGQGGQLQDPSNSTWSVGSFPLQDPFSKGWATHHDTEPGMWPSEIEEAQRTGFQFFLARPQRRTDLATILTKLKPEECLRDILSDTRVLEFPTIYVLSKDKTLPEGYALGPKDTVPRQSSAAGSKRKSPPGKKNGGKPNKKKRQDAEEGEVRSGDEDGQSDDADEAGSRGVALEMGDVVEEQSLGEEDDEDDDTSSSGSDSEMD